MGDANARGSFEERREQSMERELDQAECVIFLSADEGKVRIGFLPRDEEPNQDSPAMIFAAYINANWKQLAGEAMAMYEAYKQGLPGAGTVMGAAPDGQPQDVNLVTERPTRSIVTPEGELAKDEPVILGPDGRTLQ